MFMFVCKYRHFLQIITKIVWYIGECAYICGDKTKQMKQYGLPYKGSKSKLADKIMALFPKRTNFYDLFCGGCAMTHAALLGHKFENVIANDINWMCPTLFADAIQGKYRDEKRWISREDFERLKGTDPYVAFVWSFGNNLRDYLYGKDIEPFKRALHYAIVFRDYEPMRELGHDLSFIDGIADERKRYIAVKHYFESGQNNPFSQSLQGAGESAILSEPDTLKANNQSWLSAERISLIGGGDFSWNTIYDTKVCRDCNTANITMSYQTFVGGGNLSLHIGDYQQIDIQPDSVIYCDIPYRDTNVYDKDNDFDYDRFYDWCEKQTEPLFISSYDMPSDRFKCIAEFSHRSILCATANNKVTERVFIPQHQEIKSNIQLTLF